MKFKTLISFSSPLSVLILSSMFVCALMFSSRAKADPQVPMFRLKTGYYDLNVSAGALMQNQPLHSTMTLEPTLLWDFPTFRSRIGFHYLADYQSDFGLIPISGIGISGYFYVLGISSAYENQSDGVLYQKSRPGPYFTASITPSNLNLTIPQSVNPGLSDDKRTIIGSVLDLGIGAGYDYPLSNNVIVNGEIGYRQGTAQATNANVTDISYKGFGFMIGISATYY